MTIKELKQIREHELLKDYQVECIPQLDDSILVTVVKNSQIMQFDINEDDEIDKVIVNQMGNDFYSISGYIDGSVHTTQEAMELMRKFDETRYTKILQYLKGEFDCLIAEVKKRHSPSTYTYNLVHSVIYNYVRAKNKLWRENVIAYLDGVLCEDYDDVKMECTMGEDLEYCLVIKIDDCDIKIDFTEETTLEELFCEINNAYYDDKELV